MTDFARGGYIPGPKVTVRLTDDECLIGPDSVCRRTDEAHAASAWPPDQPAAFWSCPTREQHDRRVNR